MSAGGSETAGIIGCRAEPKTGAADTVGVSRSNELRSDFPFSGKVLEISP